MVEIPKILLLGLIEALTLVVAVVIFMGLKLQRLSSLPRQDGEEDTGQDASEAAEAEIRELRHRILELEKELEEARAAGENEAPATSGKLLILLREKAQVLAASVSAVVGSTGESEKSPEIEALESAMADLTQALAAADGGESPEAAPAEMPEEPAEGADAPEKPQAIQEDTGEVEEIPVAETPQDVVLLTARQIIALREQRDALDGFLAGLSDPAGEGAGPVQVVRDRLTAIIEALERENERLRELIEEAVPATAAEGEPSDELEAARKTIAELQEKIAATEEEMENLEREYDILYSKSATANITEDITE